MHSKRIPWPQALIVGFAALLITPLAWSASDHSHQVSNPSDAQYLANPPENVVPPGALTGEPDLRPLRLNKGLKARNPGIRVIQGSRRVKPVDGSRNILPHPPPPPRTEPCATYASLDDLNDQHDNPAGILTVEDYEDANIGGAFCVASNWVDRFGSTPCFSVGEIEDGLTIREDAPRGGNGIVVAGGGFQGLPSNYLVSNFFVDSHHYYFNDPRNMGNSAIVTAFGSTAISVLPESDLTITVELSDGTDFQFSSFGDNSGNESFGVCCDIPIDEIDVFGVANSAEGGDNITYGDDGNACIGTSQLSLDDIHFGLDVLELKLDELTGGGALR
jgi:hypothetical protein